MDDSKYLFNENLEVYKRRARIGSYIIAVATLVNIISFILRYIFEKDEIKNEISGYVITIIVLLLATIFFFAISFTKRANYFLKITENEFNLHIEINGKKIYQTSELKSFEVIKVIRKRSAKIKLIFNDNKNLMVTTRKYFEFKEVLEYLIKRNNQV